MTTAAFPRRSRSLLGHLLAAVAVAAPRLRGLIAQAVPLAREHMTAFVSFAAIDFGAFGIWHMGGWIALGVSLLLLEFKIKG